MAEDGDEGSGKLVDALEPVVEKAGGEKDNGT